MPVIDLFKALALTIIVEVGVASILGYRDRRSLAAVTLVNVITNPILNGTVMAFAVFRLMEVSTMLVLFLEAGVVLAEWGLLVKALDGGPKRLLALSLVMNSASYLTGLLIFR